jgi:hypothetical protein
MDRQCQTQVDPYFWHSPSPHTENQKQIGKGLREQYDAPLELPSQLESLLSKFDHEQ